MDPPPDAAALKSLWTRRDRLPLDVEAQVIAALDEESNALARLYAVRLVPFIVWDEPAPIVDRLFALEQGENRFVRAWSLDSLTHFAQHDAALRARVLPLLLQALASGSGAVRARAREAMKRLA